MACRKYLNTEKGIGKGRSLHSGPNQYCFNDYVLNTDMWVRIKYTCLCVKERYEKCI